MRRAYLLKPWMMICLMYILSASAAGLQLPWESHNQIDVCRKGGTSDREAQDVGWTSLRWSRANFVTRR